MDANDADQEGGGSNMEKEPDSWKLPKIPVDQVYVKESFRIFPTSITKDFEKTVILDSTSQELRGKSFRLVEKNLINWLIRKRYKYVHWGLVQVAIKPLTRDGRLEAPIIVCLRDDRLTSFENSFLAMVETDLSDGPFYFNCFPSYPVPYKDISDCNLVLTLDAEANGIPLAVTYRVVCKAMVDLLNFTVLCMPSRLTKGKTAYFQANSDIPKTTEWDEVQLPKEWTTTRGFQGETVEGDDGDDQVGGGSTMKKTPDSWKLPVDQVYKKDPFRIFPSYITKDFEKTIILDSTSLQELRGNSFRLVEKNLINWLIRKRYEYVHWGLVQVAIKPLTRDGRLEAPIIVCLRDNRLISFKSSILAMVEADLSDGPFYFNCFPSYPVPYKDISDVLVLTLDAETGGIPLALTYRVVCKAMVDVFNFTVLSKPALKTQAKARTTNYFQADSDIPKTTEWDEVQLPEEWTTT